MSCLLIFGDSWAAGSELKPGEKTFGEILASQLGMNCENFSMPSSSIPNLIEQVRATSYLNLDGDLRGSPAIFFLSSPDRDFIYTTDGQCKQLYASNESDLAAWWYRHIHTPDLARFRVNTVLLALRQICESYGIDDRYVWGWERIDLWPEIDRSRFFHQGTKTCFDLFDDIESLNISDYRSNVQNFYMSPNICHPNQFGHQRIADYLYDWLKNDHK